MIGVLILLLVTIRLAREHVAHRLLLVDLDEPRGAIDTRQTEREQRAERDDRHDDLDEQLLPLLDDAEVFAEARSLRLGAGRTVRMRAHASSPAVVRR